MMKQIALIAVLATAATSVVAENAFGVLQGAMEGDHKIVLDLVRAKDGGVVQIENLQGRVLGMTMVNPGANADVLVTLGATGAMNDLIAKLIVEDTVVDQMRIQVQ